MRHSTLTLLFFCVLVAVVSAQPVSAPKVAAESTATKYAILIGINDYVRITKLHYAKNDIEALRDELFKIGFAKENVYTLTCGTVATKNLPTKENIEIVITSVLRMAQEGDIVVLAMNGHGIEVGGQARFCPIDVKADDLLTSTVSISDIFKAFEDSKAAFKLMLVDACRDNPFLSRNIAGASVLQTIADPPKGVMLFQSCAKDEQSYEDPNLKRGVFTHYLVEGLQGKAVDKDGEVTLMGLAKYTINQTQRHALDRLRTRQQPYLRGEITDFVLASRTVDSPVQAVQAVQVSTSPLPEFDGSAGQLLRSFGGGDYSVTCVAFSPDGTMIASGGMDNAAKIWNIATGQQISAVGHSKPVTSVCFSPSNKLILSTSEDGSMKVSKVENGEAVSGADLGKAYIHAGAFLPNEYSIVIGTGTMGNITGSGKQNPMNAAHFFDVRSAKAKNIRSYVGHGNRVWSLAVSPDGTRLLTGSTDNTAIMWNIQTGAQLRTLQGHTQAINQVAFSPDGAFALTLSGNSRDNTIRVWNLETGAEIRSFTGDKQLLVRAAFSPSGKTLVAVVNAKNYGTASNPIRFWNLATGNELGAFGDKLGRIQAMALSPNGQTILIGAASDRSAEPKLKLISTGLSEME